MINNFYHLLIFKLIKIIYYFKNSYKFRFYSKNLI
jgi:hypothetical protein